MVDFPQMLPEQYLKIKSLREKRHLMTPDQEEFLDSFVDMSPIDDDKSLLLGQLYRVIKEIEELPMKPDRGVHYVVEDPREFLE